MIPDRCPIYFFCLIYNDLTFENLCVCYEIHVMENLRIHNNLRKLMLGTIVIVFIGICAVVYDIMSDFQDQVAFSHISHELIIFFPLLIILIINTLMFYKYESLIFRNLTIKETELLSLKEEKFELINLNKILAQHLSKKIAIQSDIWNLSKTEKEIAVLLIKGFSSKEIAAMRNTSEKTVREQASAIYLKAGVNNRANLASFFIEDIL